MRNVGVRLVEIALERGNLVRRPAKLGHSQMSTRADLYGHMFGERRREIASRMDSALGTGS